MTEFLLVRHCTTDWNLAGRVQGRSDIPLNEAGRALAAQLARLFAPPIRLGRIVCSPLARAVETAEIIAAAHGLTPARDERFAECAFGTLEGLTVTEIADRLGTAWPEDDEPYDFRTFGGESRLEVLSRHVAALEDHARDDGPVLVVGHGRGLNTLLAHLGIPGTLQRGDFREVRYP